MSVKIKEIIMSKVFFSLFFPLLFSSCLIQPTFSPGIPTKYTYPIIGLTTITSIGCAALGWRYAKNHYQKKEREMEEKCKELETIIKNTAHSPQLDIYLKKSKKVLKTLKWKSNIQHNDEAWVLYRNLERYLNQEKDHYKPNAWGTPLSFGKITQPKTTIKTHKINIKIKVKNSNDIGYNLELKKDLPCRSCSESSWRFEINKRTEKKINACFEKEQNTFLQWRQKYNNRIKDLFKKLNKKYPPEYYITQFAKKYILSEKTNSEMINAAQNKINPLNDLINNDLINNKKIQIFETISAIKSLAESIPKQLLLWDCYSHTTLCDSPYIAMTHEMAITTPELMKKKYQLSCYVNNSCKGGLKKMHFYYPNIATTLKNCGGIFWNSLRDLNEKEAFEAFPPFIDMDHNSAYDNLFLQDLQKNNGL